ncbi:hypothetical protein [Photobacterium swingsii]|uniref:hypothetical protein n=1 Tax=Photobacterium swingsii TaxID=680026 RepID=UPI0040678D9C
MNKETMKANFYTNQLTDDYIETVKANQNIEAVYKLLGTQFNSVESTHNRVNWDATDTSPSSYIRECLAIGMFIIGYCSLGFLKPDGANLIPSLDFEYFVSEDDESSVNLHKKSRELGTPLNRVTINKETLEMTYDVFTEDV